VNLNSNFNVEGSLRTDTYQCGQGCFSEGDAWEGSGTASCAYSDSHETDQACHCDCKNLKKVDADHYFHCGCDAGCDVDFDHENYHACNPEEDIDEKINK